MAIVWPAVDPLGVEYAGVTQVRLAPPPATTTSVHDWPSIVTLAPVKLAPSIVIVSPPAALPALGVTAEIVGGSAAARMNCLRPSPSGIGSSQVTVWSCPMTLQSTSVAAAPVTAMTIALPTTLAETEKAAPDPLSRTLAGLGEDGVSVGAAAPTRVAVNVRSAR